MNGVIVDPHKALPANTISYWTERLSQRAEFGRPFTSYALRRYVATEHSPVSADKKEL